MSSFIEDCISGDALLSDIEEYIHAWHAGESTLQLHEYLGMTFEEYGAFLEDEEILPYIVTAHKKRIDFKLFAQTEVASIAARADSHSTAQSLVRWLKQKGYGSE